MTGNFKPRIRRWDLSRTARGTPGFAAESVTQYHGPGRIKQPQAMPAAAGHHTDGDS